MDPFRILVVRLGAMGDVIHALPAVASLKHSFPRSRVSWAIRPRWIPLIENNPFVDEIIPIDRTPGGIRQAWHHLRAEKFDLAVDFQGLVQSALVAASSRADKIVGFHRSQAWEGIAALFYSTEVTATSAHIVDRNLELVSAAGASNIVPAFPIPEGSAEDSLPEGKFILASPFAGWSAKQWPLERFAELAAVMKQTLGLPLVLNGPRESADRLRSIAGAHVHLSGLAGLIDATRRAHAIVGVDSGPMHLAAALAKPGIAIFGSTDPARNGPYGGSLHVLRSATATTTYKRNAADHDMRAITAAEVAEALAAVLESKPIGVQA